MKKENKTTRIEIRVSESVKQALKEKAAKDGTTVSKLLYQFITNYIKEE